MRKDSNIKVSFTEAYRELVFLAWYRNGRPAAAAMGASLPSDDSGNKVSLSTLEHWINQYQWDARADYLDAEVAHKVENQAVQEKVEMLKRHADIGKTLQDQGTAYFKEHPVNNPSIALKMILEGAEMERESRGLPDALLKISQLSDETLESTVQKLLARVKPDEAIMATISDESSEIQEGEFVESNAT